jgi:hypothetical protein
MAVTGLCVVILIYFGIVPSLALKVGLKIFGTVVYGGIL